MNEDYIPKSKVEWILFILMNILGAPFTWVVLGVLINWYIALASIGLFFITYLMWKKIYHPEIKLKIKPRITYASKF